MLNSDFDELKNWMFGSLHELLKDVKHNTKYKIIKMSIGEPKMDPPEFIFKSLNLTNLMIELLIKLYELYQSKHLEA